MTTKARWFCLAVLSSSALMLGCGEQHADKGAGTKKGTASSAHAEGDGHKESEHAHPTEGPHHGHLIELGKEEYHAELTHDEAAKKIAVYILDSSGKEAVPVEAQELTLNLVVDGKPEQVKLAAEPQPSDPAGQASCFSVVDERILEALEAPKTTGRLNVTINGKAYVGSVEHEEHDEHDKEKGHKD